MKGTADTLWPSKPLACVVSDTLIRGQCVSQSLLWVQTSSQLALAQDKLVRFRIVKVFVELSMTDPASSSG